MNSRAISEFGKSRSGPYNAAPASSVLSGAAKLLESQRMVEMKICWYHWALGCCITFVQCHPGFAQPSASVKEATPLEPVAAVLDAFRTHRLVALDEGNHNNLQGYAFRMALIHHPEFAGLVNDIVVEAGNSTRT